MIDASPGFITFGPRMIHDTHKYGVLPFTDVIVEVEQRRRDQGRA